MPRMSRLSGSENGLPLDTVALLPDSKKLLERAEAAVLASQNLTVANQRRTFIECYLPNRLDFGEVEHLLYPPSDGSRLRRSSTFPSRLFVESPLSF